MCIHRRKIKKKTHLSILSKKEDFKKLKNQGVRIKRGCFFLFYRPNSLLKSRFAWAFCLKGPQKAVRRNRLKRWARVFMAQKQHLWSMGLDILLGVRPADYKLVNYLQHKKPKVEKLINKKLTHQTLKYKDNQALKKYEDFCLEVENLCSRINL